MSFCFLGLPFPITIILAGPLTDEQLIQFSEANKPCKIERNRQGEIVVMTPVGGIGSTNEILVSAALYMWNEAAGTGVAFSPNAGFNLRRMQRGYRWDGETRSPRKSRRGFPPLCPEFVIEVR